MIFCQLDHLLERGDFFAIPRVEGADLIESHFPDQPGPVRRAVYGVIVDDDEMPVGGHLHVKF